MPPCNICDTNPPHRRTGHHGPMSRQRLNDDESPRFCHLHGPGASRRRRDRALERNRRGVCGAESCNVRIDRRGRVRRISGSRVEDVLRAHREMTQQAGAPRSSPWLSGSFYLVSLMVITATTVIVARLAPPWTVPVVIAGSLLGVGTIGALQLRHDDRLGEQRFVELIKLTFLNIPALLRRSRRPVELPPGDQGNPSGQGTPPM